MGMIKVIVNLTRHETVEYHVTDIGQSDEAAQEEVEQLMTDGADPDVSEIHHEDADFIAFARDSDQ